MPITFAAYRKINLMKGSKSLLLKELVCIKKTPSTFLLKIIILSF